MALELVSSILLYWRDHSMINLVLLLGTGLIWGITGLKSAPAHAKLAHGFDHETYMDLMLWNRARVLLWLSRWMILIFYFFKR